MSHNRIVGTFLSRSASGKLKTIIGDYLGEEDGKIPSEISMELKRIKGLLCEAPDIREDMVADIKNQVFKRMYKVKAEQVAEKLIQHDLYTFGALEKNREHLL